MSKKSEHSTIHDIAQALGLTASSVSRALNDNPRISEATRQAVKEQAEKMNYRPNLVAAGLRTGKTGILGIIIPLANRAFFASIISGLERVANQSGYNVMICQTGDSYEAEKSAVEALLRARVEGVAVSVSAKTLDFKHFDRIKQAKIPLILFDRTMDEIGASEVVIDDRLGAMLATEHLIEQGCRRIAHFAGLQHISIYKKRTKGYLDALEKHGLSYDENLVVFGEVKEGSGDAAVNTLYERGVSFDAIFSSSDFAAIWAMKNLQKRGVRIPDDVAIIGFANEPFTELVTPALSTVNQLADDLGSAIANLFLEEINVKKEQRKPQKIVLMPEIIVRESSKRVIR
ncbi:MAG: LacI family DNA-binding transcriptional regulator [Saprospiraceae bacterium]|nr:LacI family DNA-binding transcriptional regulator [Saprospiraceae bacterium]